MIAINYLNIPIRSTFVCSNKKNYDQFYQILSGSASVFSK